MARRNKRIVEDFRRGLKHAEIVAKYDLELRQVKNVTSGAERWPLDQRRARRTLENLMREISVLPELLIRLVVHGVVLGQEYEPVTVRQLRNSRAGIKQFVVEVYANAELLAISTDLTRKITTTLRRDVCR